MVFKIMKRKEASVTTVGMHKHLTFSVEQRLKHLNSRSACEGKKNNSVAVVPVNKKTNTISTYSKEAGR